MASRGVRGARKLKALKKAERIVTVSTELELERALRAGDRLVLLEYVAAWSQPCRAMAPYLAALSQQAEFRGVDFVRIDIDACPALGLKNNVLNAPTYAFYRRGLLLESFSGAIPQRLLELLAKHKGQRPTGAPWKLLSLGAVALVTLVAAASWGAPRAEAPSLAALEDHGGDGRPPTPNIPPVTEEGDEGHQVDMLESDDEDLEGQQ